MYIVRGASLVDRNEKAGNGKKIPHRKVGDFFIPDSFFSGLFQTNDGFHPASSP